MRKKRNMNGRWHKSEREERMKVPQSTAVTSGTSQAPMSDEQLFNQSMLSWKK